MKTIEVRTLTWGAGWPDLEIENDATVVGAVYSRGSESSHILVLVEHPADRTSDDR